MTTLSAEAVTTLQNALEVQTGGNTWRKVLHTLAVAGVADNQQLIQACGLSRDRLRRLLEKMSAAASGSPPLYSVFNTRLKRGGQSGPPPRVYRLGESGAALCLADGIADARPCKLEEPRAVLHALGMLDLHLAARSAGLPVVTDRNRYYNNGENYIRPDNLVTLPDGLLAIFESEQDARSDFMNRMLRSLANKLAFFQSDAAAGFSPIVRMLVDLPRGPLWQHTLTMWRNAMEICGQTHGDELPFRLLAIPLSDFLDAPDWSAEAQTGRWVDLSEPQSGASLAAPTAIGKAAEKLPEFTNLERRMILAALYRHLQENGLPAARRAQPDPEFLYLMRLIYVASHDPFLPALQLSGVPYESLYLLDQYLRMNPALRQQIERTTQMDARRIHWNQSTCLHRMQVVVDRFLEYHGWQSNGPLLAYSHTVDYQSRSPRRFSVSVEITNPEIMITEEIAVMPGKQEIEFLEKSLTWVLTAIFAYTHHLGLKKPPFW